MTVHIQKTGAGNYAEARNLIRKLNLNHESLKDGNFWTAVENGRVIGAAHLERFKNAYYLSAVGVEAGRQRTGIGSRMVEDIVHGLRGDVYIYTTAPAFFGKLGFIQTTPPEYIPQKTIYNCRCGCTPDNCVCMVRSFNGA